MIFKRLSLIFSVGYLFWKCPSINVEELLLVPFVIVFETSFALEHSSFFALILGLFFPLVDSSSGIEVRVTFAKRGCQKTVIFFFFF